MEFFKEPNIDFLGKKWYFLAFSLVFSVAGYFPCCFGMASPWEWTSGVEFSSM